MLGATSRSWVKSRPYRLAYNKRDPLGTQRSFEASTSTALFSIASTSRPQPASILPCPVSRTSRQSIHAVSYFDFSRPDFLPNRSSSSDADVSASSPPERYLPPIPNFKLIPQTDSQQRLAEAIYAHDSEASWEAYLVLGSEKFCMSQDIYDSLLVLQCRKPLKTADREEGKKLMSQTCDRILQLCRDRQQCHIGSSSSAHDLNDSGLDSISPYVARRLLYLLIVEEEQKLHPSQAIYQPSRPNLVRLLTTATSKIEQGVETERYFFENSLRGRLASLFARLSETSSSLEQLHKLVDSLSTEGSDKPDPRPFELLLGKLAEQANNPTAPATLHSPIDEDTGIDLHNPLLRTLHLTLRSRAEVYNQVLHRCLDVLDSRTLAWLLPFQPTDVVDTANELLLDDRYKLSPRWHPWQSSAAGTIIQTDAMEAFGDRVAFVLAKRGILQPVLHILDFSFARSATSTPGTNSHLFRQDLFEIALHQLARRMRLVVTSETRKTAADHLSLTSDLRLVLRLYDLAATNRMDLNVNVHRLVIHAFSACLLTSVVNLGSTRVDYPHFPESLARSNEQQGSREDLKLQLRRFTATIIGRDHDLRGDTLDFASHATLLGLHLRTRDYDFSKRLYQLIRIREPSRELWADDDSQSLYRTALHHCSAPDRSSFGWFFVESSRVSRNAQFPLQLYLDWVASGNTLSSRLGSIFMHYLFTVGSSSIAHRVLHEMQDAKIQVPRRLARAFVISFADAGYPEYAVEIASALTNLALSSHVQPLHERDSKLTTQSTLIGSGLQILSIALDHASKADVPWSVERQKSMLRLFDDFRIGLTHQIIYTKQDELRNPRVQSNTTLATRKHVRFAYNAAMRSHVALQPSVDEMPRNCSTETIDQERETRPTSDRVVSESSRDEIQQLLQELHDLDVEPDSDTWTIRLLATLGQTVQGEGVGKERLLEAVQIFMKSTSSTFTEQGVAILCDNDAKPHRTIPVQVHPRAVAELIFRLLDFDKADTASDVYTTFQASQDSFRSRRYPFAQYFQVETAHLHVLAAQGKRQEMQEKIKHLERKSRSRAQQR